MRKLAFLFAASLLLVAGCKKDSGKGSEPDFNKLAGIWVPYSIIQQDGTAFNGPFAFMGLFGAYSESVEIRSNKTFTPLAWTSAGTMIKSEGEGGTISYDKATKKLQFDGAFHPAFTMDRFEGDELWLVSVDSAHFKFQRKG